MDKSPFRSRNIGEHQAKMVDLIAADAEQLLERSHYVTNGRYKSLFLTNFETAIMYLNKAIAFDGVSETPQEVNGDPETADSEPNEENEYGGPEGTDDPS